MKILVPLSILFMFALTSNSLGQNHAPVVSNIQASQRSDCSFIVDISYDVNDEDGDTLTVTMLVSDNDGNTWDYSYDVTHMTGDIGENILSGTNRQITWDFSEDHPQTEGSQFKFKIIAEDIKYPGIPCPGLPFIIYGGEIYPTVQIGTQCWLQKNMNYQTGNNLCLDYNPMNCDIFGRLYDWSTALVVCPSGWHLPTLQEWNTMFYYLGDVPAMKMRSKGYLENGTGLWHWFGGGYGGTNESGFTALPGGYFLSTNGVWYFGPQGYCQYWWTSTLQTNYQPPSAYYVAIWHNSFWIQVGAYWIDNEFQSVRCLKNN